MTVSTKNKADQVRVEGMSSSEQQPAESPSPLLRILLAEDNPVNLKLARLLLKRFGYRADCVSNGQEALDIMATKAYDVVLMDVQMTVMDGLEATREIRRRWPGEDCPSVIGMTANALTGFRETCIEAGMIDYISKPVEPDELKAALLRVAEIRDPRAVQDAPETEVSSGSLSEEPPEFFKEMIEPFVVDTTRSLYELRELFEQGNATGVGRVAHRLKGGCQIVGARDMAVVCEELEEKGSSGSTSGTEALIIHLEEQFQQLRSQLSE